MYGVKVMKKKLMLTIIMFVFFLTLCSCVKEKVFMVTFDVAGGSFVENQQVKENDLVIKPETPTKEGFEFDAWYKESFWVTKWNFEQDTITEDTTIYAKWKEKKAEPITLTGYYSPMNGHFDSSFKETLHSLLESTHTSKGSYSKAWEILKACDKDQNNSSNVICIYTGRSIPIANQDTGSAGDNIWNREHLWPKAKGFSSSSMTAHNDCHHLHASEKNINNTRGNKDFGIVSNPSGSDSYGNKWNGSFFEPRDEVKGDIARSLFYMVVRYDGDTCQDCTLDLELVVGGAGLSESGVKGQLGDLKALLQWHLEDPVSEEEKKRNEVVFGYQGNRNPFVDYPEWINYLYSNI